MKTKKNRKKVRREEYSREEYTYSSAPNGLCPRHEVRMLLTAISEQE